MKWKYKTRIGDKRIVRRFLIFPKTIGFETRWLETATWEQEFMGGWDGCSWDDVRWVS